MKRLGRGNYLLFVVPFVVLAFITFYLSGELRLHKDRVLFSQEIARKIPRGMLVSQSQELLKSSGFTTVPTLYEIKLPAVGKPLPLALTRKVLSFKATQRAFPAFWNKHIWTVGIVVRGNRVQEAQGGYIYSRFD